MDISNPREKPDTDKLRSLSAHILELVGLANKRLWRTGLLVFVAVQERRKLQQWPDSKLKVTERQKKRIIQNLCQQSSQVCVWGGILEVLEQD